VRFSPLRVIFTSPCDFQLSPCDFQLSPCDFQLSPCDFQLSPCDFQLSPCDFQLSPCDFLTHGKIAPIFDRYCIIFGAFGVFTCDFHLTHTRKIARNQSFTSQFENPGFSITLFCKKRPKSELYVMVTVFEQDI